MVLNSLEKQNKLVVIKLNQFNRNNFLNQAKKEGFKWSITKDIKENDECTFHVLLDFNLKTISNISTFSYINSKDLKSLPVFEYDNLKDSNLKNL